MNFWKEKKVRSYTDCFLLISLFSVFVFILYAFWVQGVGINHFFWYDQMDTGMDFFNSMIYLKGRHPYTQYGTIYPPLANLFFWILGHFVSVEEKLQWPDTFEMSVAIRTTGLDLRVHQASFLLFIVFLMILAIAYVVVISSFFENTYYGLAVGIAFTFSFGWMYALERGNIITLSLLFLLVFLRFYRSEKKWQRELAFIALAVSAGLKIYPAMFGVLLIYEKNIKELIRTVVYGILFFFAPFVLFDGVNGARAFVESILSFSQKDTVIDSVTRYHLTGIIRSFFLVLGETFKWNMTLAVFFDYSALTLFVMFSLVLGLFVCRENWKRLLILGLLELFLQDSAQYTLIFMIPAFLFFLKEERFSKKGAVYFALMVLLHLMLPVFGWLEIYRLSYATLIGQGAVAGLTILVIIDIYRQIIKMEGQKGHFLRIALFLDALLAIGKVFFGFFTGYLRQTSDMTYHIMFAQRLFHRSLSAMAAEDPGIPIQAVTYPLYHLTLKVFAFLFGRDYSLACAVLLVATIIISILLYRLLLHRILMPEKLSQKLLCDLISICSVVFVAARGAWNDWHYYAVQYAANPIHNPTILYVRPFGIIMLLAFLLFLDHYEKQEKFLGYLLIFALASVLSILAKPSFAIVFLPAMGILTIMKMISQRSLKVGIWAFLAVLPSLGALLWQFTFTTGSTEAMQVHVMFGTYYGLKPLQILGASLAVFPVPVLLASKKLFVKEDVYKIVSLALVFGWIQVFFLTNGPTGDFSWGYDLAVQLATAVSLVCAWKQELPRWRRWPALGIFLYQTLCGIGYLFLVYHTMDVWQ